MSSKPYVSYYIFFGVYIHCVCVLSSYNLISRGIAAVERLTVITEDFLECPIRYPQRLPHIISHFCRIAWMSISLHYRISPQVVFEGYLECPFPYTKTSPQVIFEGYHECPFPYTRVSPQVIFEGYLACPFPYTRASPQVIFEGYLACPFPYTRVSPQVIIEYLNC